MEKNKLDYYVELWTIKDSYYYHKLPKYVEENGEKVLEYKEIIPVYVWKKGIDYKGDITWDVCPVDFSKKENNGSGWRWSLTVNDFLNKTYFFTKKEAEEKYMEISEDLRNKYEEIKQLKRLSNK